MNSDTINNQDWTPVVLKRRVGKKDSIPGQPSQGVREAEQNEYSRMAKLDSAEQHITKKRVQPESLQELIRRRIDMKLNQEKADQLCSFPRNTFKDIEAHRAIPTQEQQSRIQRHFGIQIKISTEKIII
jgi:hypothetical protein